MTTIPWTAAAPVYIRIPLEGGPPRERADMKGSVRDAVIYVTGQSSDARKFLVIKLDDGTAEYDAVKAMRMLDRMPFNPRGV